MKLIGTLFVLLLLSYSQTVSSQISGIVNDYRKIIAIDSSKGIMKLQNAGGMTPYIGRTVMIIQMKGATIQSASQSASFGDITAIKEAGNFEFGKICGQQSDTIILENKLQNFYDPTGYVQLVVLPKYGNITVTDTLKAKSWDPVSGTGGVLAIESTDTVFLNKPMYADSTGFRGGSLVNYSGGSCADNNFPPFAYTCDEYYLSSNPSNGFKSGGKKGEGIADYISTKEHAKGKSANAGGGGNNSNNGGGGGSNYGAGGTGGYNTSGACTNPNQGIGGKELFGYGYTLSLYRLFLGGGGGSGHENNNVGSPGGAGGGIVYLKCRVLKSANQKITANGKGPYQIGLYSNGTVADGDGGGGGGGGGVVILHTSNIINNVFVETKGGNGSNTGAAGGACAGPGGGGGGGVVWLSSATIPANVFIANGGGNPGTATGTGCGNSTNGAAAGGNGTTVYNFTLPPARDSSPVCKAILPKSVIVSFKGFEDRFSRKFTVTLSDFSELRNLMLQRSTDGRQFTDLSTQPVNGSLVHNFNDDILPGIIYYRLKLVKLDGQEQYSAVITFRKEKNGTPLLTIFPNPADQRLSFNIRVKEREIVNATISDQSGRVYTSVRIILTPMSDQYSLPLSGLARGSYQLLLSGDSFKVSKRFTKL